MKLSDIIPMLEAIAPPEYAMKDDPIGLQIGDPDQDVQRVVVSVDASPAVVNEVIRRSADLLITHHPLVYSPLRSVRMDVYPQSLVYQIVNSGTSLYTMHTNFDAADGGINDVLAEQLALVDTKVLDPTHTAKMFKLVTFVPVENIDAVRDALGDAGAGVIGEYTNCSFQSQGIGTFKPMPGAGPYVGTVGEFHQEPEFRLEVLAAEGVLHDAISAMIEAHPYEEVAYDVIPLWNKGEVHGVGRYGRLRSPMTFDGFCEMVRDVLDVDDARISGDPESTIETVAIVGGGGGCDVGLAHSKGVDAFLTGDVRHHEFLQAKALGLNIIDATHFATERPGMIALAPKLYELLSPDDITVEYVDDWTLRG